MNLSDNTHDQPSKLTTKNWVEKKMMDHTERKTLVAKLNLKLL